MRFHAAARIPDSPDELTPYEAVSRVHLHRAGLKRAFVDLRHLPPNHWLRSRLVAQPVSYAPMRADWTQVYDALFFIDTMPPSMRTGTVP